MALDGCRSKYFHATTNQKHVAEINNGTKEGCKWQRVGRKRDSIILGAIVLGGDEKKSLLGGYQNALEQFRPDLDQSKSGLNLVELQNRMGGCLNWSRRFLPDSRFGPDLVQIRSRSRYMAVQIKKSGQHVQTCCPDSGLVQTAFSYDPCFFSEAALLIVPSQPPPPVLPSALSHSIVKCYQGRQG
jgi:hypothetical protein